MHKYNYSYNSRASYQLVESIVLVSLVFSFFLFIRLCAVP